jgi:hypothetical protein
VGHAAVLFGLVACSGSDRAPLIDTSRSPRSDGGTTAVSDPDTPTPSKAGQRGTSPPTGKGPLDPTHVYHQRINVKSDQGYCEELFDVEAPDEQLRLTPTDTLIALVVHPTSGLLARAGNQVRSYFRPVVTTGCPERGNGLGRFECQIISSNTWTHVVIDPDGNDWVDDTEDLTADGYYTVYAGHGGVRLVTNISNWRIWHPDGTLVALSDPVDHLIAARAMSDHFLVIDYHSFKTISYETGEVTDIGALKRIGALDADACALDGDGRAVCFDAGTISRFEPDQDGVVLVEQASRNDWLFSGP